MLPETNTVMTKLLFSLFLLSFCFACTKETIFQPSLAAPSFEGKNTFGFNYNGHNIWASISHGDFNTNTPNNVPNATCAVYDSLLVNKKITLFGDLTAKSGAVIVNDSHFEVRLYNVPLLLPLSIGTLSFDTSSAQKSNRVFFSDYKSSKAYANYTNNTFSLTLTNLDTTKKIISGLFSGTLYKLDTAIFSLTDSMTITNGSFDVRYHYQ